ncbi:MAG: TRAP transporter small permease subunit, partial [candidate division WOR-3 bacterium]
KFIKMVSYSSWCLVPMAFITTVHVVGRYFLNRPMFGQTEVVLLFQIAVVSLCTSGAFIEGRHVSIPLLVPRLSKVQKKILFGFTLILLCIFFVFGGISTLKQAVAAYYRGRTTELLRLPLCIHYMLIAVGWFFLALGVILARLRFSNTERG